METPKGVDTGAEDENARQRDGGMKGQPLGRGNSGRAAETKEGSVCDCKDAKQRYEPDEAREEPLVGNEQSTEARTLFEL
jgi:hypothetical protein